MYRNFSRGFTLIELLVVISIISLLASIVLATLNTTRGKAKVAAALAFETSMYLAHGDQIQAGFTFDTTLLDSTGAYTGSLASPTYSTDVPNKTGTSLLLNGSQTVNVTIDVSETAYAVGMWFKTSTANGGLFDVNGGGNDREIYLLGGSVCGRVWNDETICSPSTSYADNNWHYLLHTYGGSMGGQQLYVDGVRVAKGSKNYSDFNWQTSVSIGYSAVGTPSNFNGLIDSVRIYSTSFAGD